MSRAIHAAAALTPAEVLPDRAGIVFDLDGTLIDSAPTIAQILDGMRAERGLGELPLQQYRQWSSAGGSTLIARSLGASSGDIPGLVTEFRRRYGGLPTPLESVFPGVRTLLQGLADAGRRLAICSNKPEHLCRKVLAETGLARFFLAVVGGDTTPERKPSKLPLEHAAARIGLDTAHILFVGDSRIDLATSRAAGVPFVFFDSGYDIVEPASCHFLTDRHAELQSVLLGWHMPAKQTVDPERLTRFADANPRRSPARSS